ncbi:MAG: extracellular solute-binding protein [Treponema sp.]|jgi:multiple sugar transport system substrate-binding protein|nr:extracellular solute-binding protein [Treponema sp.]
MMNKRFLCLVLLPVLAAAFVFGGGARDASGSQKLTEIVVWTNDGHNKTDYEAAVAAFNAADGLGPKNGIKLTYTVYGGDYWNAVDVAAQTGELPYIYKTNQRLPQHVAQGIVLPYEELPSYSAKINRYRQYQYEGITSFGGKIYALDVMGTAYSSMAYNKDLLKAAGFDAPPETWAEFERVVIAESRVDSGKKFGMAIPLGYVNYHENFIDRVFAPSYGKYFWDFTRGRFVFSEFTEFFEMINRITKAGGMYPGIENLNDDTFRAQFAEGNIGFILVNPSYNVGVLYDQFPAKIDWGVAPIPVKDTAKSYNPSAGGASYYSINVKAKKDGVLQQVQTVLDFLTNDDLIADMFTTGKNIPLLPEIAAKAKPSDRPQWNDTALYNANAVIRPPRAEYDVQVEGDTIYTVFSKILLGQTAPGPALQDLDRRYNAAYDQGVRQGKINAGKYNDPKVEQLFSKK